MKNAKRNFFAPLNYLTLLVAAGILLIGCEVGEHDHPRNSENLENLTDIKGEYICTGECITTDKGKKTVVTVTGESDKIERYPDAKEPLYQVSIKNGTFSETEIGALSGRTLRTATANVSDSTYPVLEEYVFDVDDAGAVIGFTKTVRNPNHVNFKTCVIYGTKVKK